MAEKTGLPDIFPFHSLLTMLEGSGFRFGVDTRVRMGEYWQLVAKDEQLSRSDLKTHLSALLCRSAEEQERFERVFDVYAPPGLKPIVADFLGGGPSLLTPIAPLFDVKIDEKTTGQPTQDQVAQPTPPLPSKSTQRLGAVLPMLTFPEEPFRIWNLRGMSEALMLLQEKVLTETSEWDVPGTIRAIIRSGGYPKLAYRRRRQAPRYLVLIEQQSPRDHLAGYAAELVKEINHRDLEVAYYFFDKNPARCWRVWRDPLTHVNLELLKSEWNGARLLLLSHASCFINPATGTPSNLALELPDSFGHVALLATNSPLEWGAAERSLQTLMPVLPLGIEGLGRLMAAWNGEAQLSFGDWQMLLPEPVPTQLSGAAAQRPPAEVFMDVYRYLGKDAFRWLCACAVYPEIYFELTSILHDEAIPPLTDLSEWEQHEKWNQALRLLSRLYWFRRGYLPSTMLDDLKRNLKPADLALVEGEIRRILEISKNRVGEATHAAGIRQQMFDWMAEQGFRVLWIDDNPENNQRLIDSWSKSLGILFRQALSTTEAATMLEKERFDLIISDIGRKDEDNPASATLKMAKRLSPEPPVVFFTDKRGMRLRGVLMETGAYQVTDDIEELQQALSKVWDRKFRPVEEAPPQEQVQQQAAGSMPPPESSYQSNVDEPPPLNQTVQDQEMLKKLGYYEGAVDGVPGEQFRSAILEFQRLNRLIEDGIMGPKTRNELRKIVERHDAESEIPEVWRKRARSVCKITLPDGSSGNGFLVEDGFVFTAKAVLPDANSVIGAEAHFYGFGDSVSLIYPLESKEYSAGDGNVDYVLVRIADRKPDVMYGQKVAKLSSKGLGTGDKVSLIFLHPANKLMPVFLPEAPVVEFTNESFAYEATTEFSVIGAPAFNANGEVVGITLREEGQLKRGRLMRSITIPSSLSLNDIRNLIAEDKIEEGLNELRRMFPDNNEIVMQLGRWNTLKRNQLAGVIDSQQFNIQLNQIRAAILVLLDDLENKNPTSTNANNKRSRFLFTSGRGSAVHDSPYMESSPFSQAIVETLKHNNQPEITISQLAHEVENYVTQYSTSQQPQLISANTIADGGDFIFKKSAPLTKGPETKQSVPFGTNYLILIGLNDYYYFPKLIAPVRNAKNLQNVLLENYRYENSRTVILLDKEVTRKSIFDILHRSIEQITENDNLIVYFSGHCYHVEEPAQSYWIPADGKPDELDSFFSGEELNAILQKCRALNILVIEDAYNVNGGDRTRTSSSYSA